jgi:hypothetical protein
VRLRAFAPGLLALIVAAAIGALVPVLFGTPRAQVHIRWQHLGDGERALLEDRFHLSEATRRGEGTWSYVPLDTSRETLRALVRNESVAATDGIDRASFRISSGAPLTERRGGVVPGAPPVAARVGKLAASVLALAGVLLLIAAAFAPAAGSSSSMLAAAGDRLRDPRSLGAAMHAWVARGIPMVTPASLATFRVAFAVLVTAYVWSEPVYPELLAPYEVGGAAGLYGVIVRALAERPALVDGLRFGVLAAGLAFAAGLRPRLSFAAFCACVMLWACVLTLRTTSHAVSALLLTMLCLLPARWGEAWSLDTLLRRKTSGRQDAGRHSGSGTALISGFPIWVPVLVLGVTFAAAAWAKIQNGLGWILNGTVKYHFISDMEHAWVDWGVRMTESHAVAVALSAGAVIVETLLITAALSRSDGYRLAMGLAALGLLAGFALFQGVLWPGWWVLLVGFLPWRRMSGTRLTSSADAVPRLRAVELVVVLVIVGQQVYASAMHVEARPVITAYDMYSTTYDTPDDYEAASNLVYRVVGIEGRQPVELAGCVVDDAAVRQFEAASGGDAGARARVKGLLGPCLSKHPGVTMVRLEGDRQVYDWEQRRFEWRRRLDVVGPVRIDWIRE